jgi:hypothetical protein
MRDERQHHIGGRTNRPRTKAALSSSGDLALLAYQDCHMNVSDAKHLAAILRLNTWLLSQA